MKNTVTIIQHQTFLAIYKLSLKAMWKFKIIRIIILIYLIINLLSWFFKAISTKSPEWYMLLYNLLTVLPFAGIYALLALISVFFMRLSKPQFFKPVTYHFDHWGLHLQGKEYNGSVPWRKLTKVETTESEYIFYESNVLSFNIAKKNFQTTEELEAFEQMVRDHVNE
ncbi:MAG TPA: YcxB family protein [Segetibacter sp.]|jgi:hypothetical protein